MRFLTAVALVAVLNPRTCGSSFQTFEEKIQEQLLTNYSRIGRPRPLGDEHGATIVDVSMYFRNIAAIDELRMEFTADVLIRQYWNDPRLAFDVPANSSDLHFLALSPETAGRIWVPDISFPTLRTGSRFELVVPNTLCRVYPNGDILLSVRYLLTLSCDMDFKEYPFDEQECLVGLEVFGSTADAVILRWKAGRGGLVKQQLPLPKFKLLGMSPVHCESVHFTGNFSCLFLKLKLGRDVRYHVIETFLPTTILVVASWFGFWIEPTSTSERVGLAVVLMLTIVALGSDTKRNLPQVSYIKAIDIWLGVCIWFVFLSLLEFGIVNYLSRHYNQPFSLACLCPKRRRPKFRWGRAAVTKTDPTPEGPLEATVPEHSSLTRRATGVYEVSNLGLVKKGSYALANGPLSIPNNGAFLKQTNMRNVFDPREDISKEKGVGSKLLDGVADDRCPTGDLIPVKAETKEEKKYRTVASFLDIASRVLFPIVFLVIATVYFTVYSK